MAESEVYQLSDPVSVFVSGHVVHRESTLSLYRETAKGQQSLFCLVNSVIFTIQHIRKSSFKLSEHWESYGVKAKSCVAVQKLFRFSE